MRVAVIGTGYVGLVSAVCLTHMGHRVVGVDNDPEKLTCLQEGRSPIYEPGLQEDLTLAMGTGRLRFHGDLAAAVAGSGVIFIAVGTPPLPSGASDTKAVASVATAVGAALAGDRQPRLVVNKSTVPIGTGARVQDLVTRAAAAAGGAPPPVTVVSNPEFLREGQALWDSYNPDRVVLGSDDPAALLTMEQLYAPLVKRRCRGCDISRPGPIPLIKTDLASAEMIKYAANAFLATKVSFINELALLCDDLGADITLVADGIGLDKRIGRAFLDAGIGWGGSCLPKDLAALLHTAVSQGIQPRLLEAVTAVNQDQRRLVVRKLQRALPGLRGRTIGLLGLTFKPGTDDLREAPALDVAAELIRLGARVKGFDPYWSRQDLWPQALASIQRCSSAMAMAQGCDALVAITEWPEFKLLDWEQLGQVMGRRLVVDGRNCLDGAALTAAGFCWQGMGRNPPAH
ncbi:MAG: UDP-glucose/GDP-mannose dehydrogenase family protein [Cyanobacteria bacterium MAG CAR1_bin_15]|nr:UDP-glucose/GDP-mannose dehydrogenase family protein [Cyanobacteria bacterium MAG CAR1_bin_15]